MQSLSFPRLNATSLGIAFLLALSLSVLAFAQSPASNAVNLKDFMFEPMSLTIHAGTSVTWKNLDGEPHTVVSDSGLFRSSALDQNDSFTWKFDKPGTYNVFCGIHPNMKETITVQ
jgi:plastocyanin